MNNLISKYLPVKRSIAVEDNELSKLLKIVNKNRKNTKVKVDQNDQFNESRYFITICCTDTQWTRLKATIIANCLSTVYTLETRYFKL